MFYNKQQKYIKIILLLLITKHGASVRFYSVYQYPHLIKIA